MLFDAATLNWAACCYVDTWFPRRPYLRWLDMNHHRQHIGDGGGEMASLVWMRDHHIYVRLSPPSRQKRVTPDCVWKSDSVMPPFLSANARTCCTSPLQHRDLPDSAAAFVLCVKRWNMNEILSFRITCVAPVLRWLENFQSIYCNFRMKFRWIQCGLVWRMSSLLKRRQKLLKDYLGRALRCSNSPRERARDALIILTTCAWALRAVITGYTKSNKQANCFADLNHQSKIIPRCVYI